MNYIEYSKENRIGYIVLNRPEKSNALNFAVVSELKTAFSQAAEDKEVKVIILKAKGKVFCAGADLGYLQQLQQNNYQENLQDSNHLRELFYQIYTLNKIVIAQVHGHAIAGGCGLASVCDFAFTVPAAKFGYTEVRIGFVPAIVTIFLLRKIGEMKAKSLLLSGELITAAEAKDLGLVNNIFDEAGLEKQVQEFAEMLIAKNSGQSLTATKQLIANTQEMGLEEGLSYAAALNAKTRDTSDCQKGIAAFLAKEEVKW